ncbi:MAG: hypothetical protein QJR06_07405 [Alicyclobacillaceae bacterium]|nr:hypothetical protein [Alicyclobacillaceae bacterium]
MTVWLGEWKALRSAMAGVVAGYGGLIIASLLLADRPRTVFYYNEMAMVPLAVMAAALLFQRELAGNQMEILAVCPVSLGAMTVRKWLWAVGLVLGFHMLWTRVYLWKFKQMVAPVYSFSDQAWRVGPVGEYQLLALALPEYLAAAGMAVLAMIAVKRMYAGLLAGFGFWLLESLQGAALGTAALFTVHLPAGAPVLANRLLWGAVGIGCALAAAAWAERRERWILSDTPE